MHRHGGDLQNWRIAPCGRRVGSHPVPSFAAGNPEWIRKAGLMNHDIETAEEFWSFAKKLSVRSQRGGRTAARLRRWPTIALR
jgi:hypothetical protein